MMPANRKTAAALVAVLTLSPALPTVARGDDGLFDDGAATAAGDIIESRGDLIESLGRGSLLRSLSAKELQEAIDRNLDNRRESIEMYYDLKEIGEEYREAENAEDRLSPSQIRELAARRAPDRLNDQQINRETGELYWPSPLDSPLLKPYRKPIEDTLDKRGQSGVTYRKQDYFKVRNMVQRIEEAVEVIKQQMDVREVVALQNYLDQIEYEARFDLQDNRVDL